MRTENGVLHVEELYKSAADCETESLRLGCNLRVILQIIFATGHYRQEINNV